METIPLMEFDDEKTAIVEPTMVYNNVNPPEHCVMPIYRHLIEKLESDGRLEKIFELETPLIPIDVYKIAFEGGLVTVVNPGVGAAWVAAHLEELIALGCRKFVACGSAGVLKAELRRGAIVIPNSAVRDEGTSYHYCPPSRIIGMNEEVVNDLELVLQKHMVNYEIGKTWTTDAPYRETKGKISKRKAEGCLTVDMECSALLAVSKFRKVKFGQYLAVGDDVSGQKWDPRYVDNEMPLQEKVFWLSIEACLEL